jgi:hypothetical protein
VKTLYKEEKKRYKRLNIQLNQMSNDKIEKHEFKKRKKNNNNNK